MSFNIEEFSSFLCYVLTPKILLPDKCEITRFQIGVNAGSLKAILDHLGSVYRKEYWKIMDIIKGPQINTFSLFMKAIIVRCMKISEETITYGHFMLVCSLVYYICSDYLWTSDCFACPNLCRISLVSVYNRCYKEFFDSKEGTDDTLDSYLKSWTSLLLLDKCLEGGITATPAGDLDVNSVMASLVDLDDLEFPLTEYEQTMMEENTNPLALRHPPPFPTAHAFYVSADEPESLTSEEFSLEDTTSSSSEELDEDIFETWAKQAASMSSSKKAKTPNFKEAGEAMDRPKVSVAKDVSSPSMSSGIKGNRPNFEKFSEEMDRPMVSVAKDVSSPSTSSGIFSGGSNFKKLLEERKRHKVLEEDMSSPSTSSGMNVNRPNFKEAGKAMDVQESSEDSSMSSSSASDIIEPDRTPDFQYFKFLICKFCRLRCSCHATFYIERHLD